MARKRRGRPVHGWVAVDKPVGPTSTQVVGRVRRVFDAQKVGHGGTLDPMASGLLPIALGEATKTVSYVMDAEKTYRFTVRWGQATDSDDAEGAVTAESPHRPDEAAIRAVLPDFTGRLSQVPPAYSAIKVATMRFSRPAAAKGPICAPWRATWARPWAPADTSRPCAESALGRSKKTTRFPWKL
jgi:tRNA pseudouridine55 synthase